MMCVVYRARVFPFTEQAPLGAEFDVSWRAIIFIRGRIRGSLLPNRLQPILLV